MYIPKTFLQADLAEVTAFVREYPLASVVVNSVEGMTANPMPLLLDDVVQPMLLRGHIAKANDLWRLCEEGSEVLVIFQSPGAYVSPSFYPSKQRDPKVVPTWNYRAVHVSAQIRFVHDSGWKAQLVERMTAAHEAAVNPGQPWRVSDAPAQYLERMLNAIVGVELVVTRVEAKWKMSQNQSLENREGVVTVLGDAY